MPRRVRVLPFALLLASGFGCGESSNGPSVGGFASLSVASITPTSGTTNYPQIFFVTGTGFKADATVHLGGVLVGSASVISATRITGYTPMHDAGPVDVIVSNPDGRSVTLTSGFTFHPVTLTVNPPIVSAGAPLTVGWTAQGRPVNVGDWIGICPAGASNMNCENHWWQYVSPPAGTAALAAPPQPGEYEFRYFPDDRYEDVAAVRVTVQ